MIRFFLILLGLWGAGLGVFLSPLPTNQEPTDAIVVFTGGQGRVKEGVHLFERGMASYLFISGVSKGVERQTLYGLFKTTVPNAHSLFLGYQANSTHENALETKAWAEKNNIKTIRLVTAHYHMRRSLLECETHMPRVTFIPHAIIPQRFQEKSWWRQKKLVLLVLREYHKFLYMYLVRGLI